MKTLLSENCMKLGFGMMRLPRIEGANTIDLEALHTDGGRIHRGGWQIL